LPQGWRVVCRLSRSDARSRWGTRPRPPAATSPASAANRTAAGVVFEADLIAPELNQPLRVPLLLLPQWVDPKVGTPFMGRYEIRKELPEKPGLERVGVKKGPRLEAYDQEERVECALQVCELARDSDVQAFAERLQLESLDSENRLFLRLRSLAISLPSRVIAVEDLPRKKLWDEFGRIEKGTGLAAKLASIASSVLSGLCRLHAHGWAHCGISPETVCLATDGCWKLTSLELSRKVSTLNPSVLVQKGTEFPPALPPEALLGLPVTEKVDVWQLAASLCEAIMQKRVYHSDTGAPDGDGASLCRLVDFLGPIPSNLVTRHPDREALFTPEGQLLRPATPDASGHDLEAIEPVVSSVNTSDSDPIPRPRLVVEALEGVEGAGDILEFLGRLLNPDPEQRPSAQEAQAHHFLRFVQKAEGGAGDRSGAASGKEGEHHVHIQDSHKDNENKISRKGTGFVHVGELPPSDDEDEEEEERPHHVQIKDSHGDCENKISRKGTGFVHIGELPPSDEEDEDEEDSKPQHVQIKDTHGDNENKITRKGTGFVHVGELPPSDDEDEEEEHHHVQIQDEHGDCENKLQRKGTGFVHIGELPPSDDEDEEEEQQHVQIQDSHGDNESKISRKGTGFVHIGELPPSDDEDEEEEAPAHHVQIQDSHGDCENKISRKGTGFVHVGELPPSDDEEEEEAHHVQIQDSHGDNENKITRKGTGFVHIGELPPSDDEDEEEEESQQRAGHHATIQDSHGDCENKISRKGTGFVHIGELPPSDDEDEEDDAPKGHVQIQDSHGDCENKITRKGTGFVHIGELPPSDDEDEDEPVHHAKIDDSHGDNENSISRKGTGFVRMEDLDGMDDEDDEDDEESDAKKGGVRFTASADPSAEDPKQKEAGKPMRKGTGFVSASELPDTDDEED